MMMMKYLYDANTTRTRERSPISALTAPGVEPYVDKDTNALRPCQTTTVLVGDDMNVSTVWACPLIVWSSVGDLSPIGNNKHCQ